MFETLAKAQKHYRRASELRTYKKVNNGEMPIHYIAKYGI